MAQDTNRLDPNGTGLDITIARQPTFSATIVVAPVISALPIIIGPAQVGSLLSATVGTWANNPTAYAYQWKRAGVAIAGATNPTYTPVALDVGAVLSCTVTATNSAGSASSTSLATVAVADAVATSVPANSAAPTISGTAQEGQTLSVTNGTWSNSPDTYAYQWKRDGAAISGSINATRILTTADVGAVITCTVTATNAAGSASATSAGTTAVIAASVPVPVNSTAPVISGTGTIGQTLSTTNGAWTNSPTSYAYQWRRAGVNISGATSATYVLVSADGGNAITCRVTAANAGGSTPAVSNAISVASSSSLPANVKITFKGDSETAYSSAGEANSTWAIKSQAYLPSGPAYTFQNAGSPGQTAVSMNTDFATTTGNTLTAGYVPGAFNVGTIMGGTNDAGAIVAYRNLRQMARKARLLGYDRLLGITIPARNDGTNYTGEAAPVNVAIRAGLANGDYPVDDVSDIGRVTNFTLATDPANATYYGTAVGTSDNLHNTQSAGTTLSASVTGPKLAALITTANPYTRPVDGYAYNAFTLEIEMTNGDRSIRWDTTGFGDRGLRARTPLPAGKSYFEISITAGDSAYGSQPYTGEVGLVNGTWAPDGTNNGPSSLSDAGSNAIGVGYRRTDSANYGVWMNGVKLGAGMSPANLALADVIQICVDRTANLMWVRKNNTGAWNVGNTNADPATGVGGYDISALGTGSLYAASCLATAASGKHTLALRAAQQAYAAPTGFTAAMAAA